MSCSATKIAYKLLFAVVGGVCLLQSDLQALPFNDDMVNNQIKTGQIMRPAVKGTIARGALEYRLENEAAAQSLTNPFAENALSIKSGERLFRVHCYACHGDITKTPHQPAAAGRYLGAPDLTMAPYRDRTDGSIYGTIHFGGMAVMPALGWKLSRTETWDIVSYVRSIQKIKNNPASAK
jgi:mono/diheme cytochrome c family protein